VSNICSAQAVQPRQQVEPNGAAESAESVQPLQPAQSAPSSQPAEVAGRVKRKRRAPDLDEYENNALLYLNDQKAVRSRSQNKKHASYPQSRALQVIRSLRTAGTNPLAERQALWTSEVGLIPSQETSSESCGESSALRFLASMHERAEIAKSRGEIATRFTTLLLHHEYERIQSRCEGQAVAEEMFVRSTGRSTKDSTQDRTNAQAWLRLMEIFGSGALLMPDTASNSA
jgi:hypothetical protein